MGQHLRLLLILAIASAHSLRAQQPSFRIFSTQDGLVRNWVTKIHRDSKGYLWFCTVEGISLFDGDRFANFSPRGRPPGPAGPRHDRDAAGGLLVRHRRRLGAIS